MSSPFILLLASFLVFLILTFADSDSDFALDVKELIKKNLKEGKKDEEIYNYLKLKYGDWILYKTPINVSTIFIWMLPIIFILIGLRFIVKRIRFE